MTDIHGLITNIYDAGLGNTRWEDVLREVGTLLHGSGVNLFTVDQSNNLMPFYSSWNIPEEGMDEYQEFIKSDPRMEYEARHPFADAYYDYLLIDEAGIDRDPYYDWCQRQGDFRYFVGRGFAVDDRYKSYLAVQRGKRQGHVSKSDVRLFKNVAAHVGRAIEINRRTETLNATAHGQAEALDSLSHAVFFFDARGSVLSMNALAERIVSKGDGLLIANRMLAACSTRDTDFLRAQVKNALSIRANGSMEPARKFTIARPNQAQRLIGMVVPVGNAEPRHNPLSPAAMMLVRDPTQTRVDATDLQGIFGLTPAEAALAGSLAEGMSLTEYAQHAGCSAGTARWHLKRVFTKTETRSQAELVALILRSLA